MSELIDALADNLLEVTGSCAEDHPDFKRFLEDLMVQLRESDVEGALLVAGVALVRLGLVEIMRTSYKTVGIPDMDGDPDINLATAMLSMLPQLTSSVESEIREFVAAAILHEIDNRGKLDVLIKVMDQPSKPKPDARNH